MLRRAARAATRPRTNQSGARVGAVRRRVDTFALYVKTKNFHWHVSGSHFRDYHLLLDEQAAQIFGRPVRRPRRVPPRRDRAEPQDAGPAPHSAATTAHPRVSCVASVAGVSAGADAHMAEAQKPQSALHLPDQTDSQASTALAVDFLDSIDHDQTSLGPGSCAG
jgi:starvation-inducible DNA-binding protein